MTTPDIHVHVHVHTPDLDRVTAQLDRIEEAMATAAEQINALNDRITAQGAVLADVAADFAALVAAMTAERENLTPAGQAAIDAANDNLTARNEQLAALDAAVGDADNSDATPEPEPTPAP